MEYHATIGIVGIITLSCNPLCICMVGINWNTMQLYGGRILSCNPLCICNPGWALIGIYNSQYMYMQTVVAAKLYVAFLNTYMYMYCCTCTLCYVHQHSEYIISRTPGRLAIVADGAFLFKEILIIKVSHQSRVNNGWHYN